MSNDWRWNSPDWRQPDEAGSLDNGLGNYPTQQSSGGSNPDPFWNPVSLPPPPPDPLPYSAYGQSGYEQSSGPATPSLFSDYGQSGNPYNQPPPLGGYPFAPAPMPVARSRSRPWFLIPLLSFLVVAVIGVGITVYAFNAISKAVKQTTQQLGGSNNSSAGPVTITVGAHPTIVIDRNAGAVKVQGAADSQQVTIEPIGDNSPLDGPITYSKSGTGGNTITFDLSNIETVNVLLKVPEESDLNITTNGDDITVIGVTGQQNLSSNAGNLNVSNDTLMGKSTLDTNGGSITFSGTLDPQSSDHFSTITLPANANFHADITNNGGVIQSAFPQVVVSDGSASGDVGKAPFAELEVDSNGGMIQLNKAA